MQILSLSVLIAGRRKTQKGEKHALIFVECVSLYITHIYIYILSSSCWAACSDGTSNTGAVVQCRLIHVREVKASKLIPIPQTT